MRSGGCQAAGEKEGGENGLVVIGLCGILFAEQSDPKGQGRVYHAEDAGKEWFFINVRKFFHSAIIVLPVIPRNQSKPFGRLKSP